MRRLLFVAASIVTAASGVLTAGSATPTSITAIPAPVVAACPQAQPATRAVSEALRVGVGVWASADGGLTQTAPSEAAGIVEERGPGIVRHVFARAGVGTTYVRDRRGGDVVVMVTSDGVVRMPQETEAFHPSLSSRGDLVWSIGTGLRIRSSARGTVEAIDPPTRGSTTFAPVYVEGDALVTVASAPPNASNPEGARQDNLFRLGSERGRWRPLTAFRSHGDRWTAIRTPVLTPRGGLEFIRVQADASEAVEPTFELWRIPIDGRAHRVRALDREMYLAGWAAGHRLWNVPAPAGGAATIQRSGPSGRLVEVGCGSIAIDPADVADPDRRSGGGALVPPRRPWSDLDQPAVAQGSLPGLGIIVGDFRVRASAEAAAAQIASAFPDASVDVVDSTTAPLAIRPGVWGAMMLLADGADPTEALAGFRSRLPEFAEISWVVTP